MSRTITLEDHSEALKEQNKLLEFDLSRTAILTVDLNQGHIGPHATVPVGPALSERVLRGASDVLRFARKNGMQVVHVTLRFRPIEAPTFYNHPRVATTGLTLANDNPGSDAAERGVYHNVEGSIQAQLHPEIGPEPGDHLITNKKTASAFLGTDLEMLLRRILDVDTVVIMGINTNTCVLCTAFDASNLGFRVILIEEGCVSSYGEDLHVFALNAVSRTIGWVLDAEEFKNKVHAASLAATPAG